MTATGGGGGGGAGGGSGGGGGSMCSSGNCDLNGNCVQSFEGRVAGRCGTGLCTTCSLAQRCVLGACEGFKRIFATRTTYTGNLGGLTGADAKCTLAASAAGLPGTYKAWLSDGTTDALTRITADGPWFSALRSAFDNTTTSKRMFNNKANLQTLPLDNYLSWADETGADFEGSIWTGTATGGTRSADTCTNWTSASAGQGVTGRLGGTSGVSVWTQYNNPTACSVPASLLCIEN